MTIAFIQPESFLRSKNRTNPFFDPIIDVLTKSKECDEWLLFLPSSETKCGYSEERVRHFNAIRVWKKWIFRVLRLLMPAWRACYWFGKLARPFCGEFAKADVFVTIAGMFGYELAGMFPGKRVVDIQHGVIYSKHNGYFDSDGSLLKAFRHCKKREFWVYGKGYADCFFKNPANEKDLKGRVKIIGDVLRAGEGSSVGAKECGSEGVRDLVVLSAQLTPDLGFEELEASVERMEEFFDEFFSQFGDKYKCLLKHHPRYDNVYPLDSFFAKFPQVKETTDPWTALYPRMALHVTFTSTVTFDCASAGVPTYLLDFPAAKILHREFWRDDYGYPYYDKTAEGLLAMPRDEVRKTMLEWYGKFYAPFDEATCLRLLCGDVD